MNFWTGVVIGAVAIMAFSVVFSNNRNKPRM